MKKGAHFSADRTHRYLLWRIWRKSLGLICFIGLNPSTADGHDNDSTIRRLIHFTEQEKFGGFYIVNLFSFRSRDFKDVKLAKIPTNEKNDEYIKSYTRKTRLVCLMWGGKGTYLNRDKEVLEMIKSPELKYLSIHCFGETKKGNPKHPLYLPNITELTLYGS